MERGKRRKKNNPINLEYEVHVKNKYHLRSLKLDEEMIIVSIYNPPENILDKVDLENMFNKKQMKISLWWGFKFTSSVGL